MASVVFKGMKQYLDLVRDILDNGEIHENRTGVDTKRVWGRMIRHNLCDGFPLLTTKKMATKASFVEMLGFIRGEINIEWYRERGCNVWNANYEDWRYKLENEMNKLRVLELTDDSSMSESERCLHLAEIERLDKIINYKVSNPYSMGYIYGYQWRNMNGFDQLGYIYNELKNGSNSRRLIMSGWNPSEFDMMCLPPCHVMYHFSRRGDYLDIAMTQRSCDIGLGVPFNLANTALICHIMAHCTGLKPGEMVWTGHDVHIYVNHINQLTEQLSREPRKLPELRINASPDVKPWEIEYEDLEIVGYDPHPRIKMSMAV